MLIDSAPEAGYHTIGSLFFFINFYQNRCTLYAIVTDFPASVVAVIRFLIESKLPF